MIIQGTETLSSFIHIVSESLLTPVMILIVVFLVVVILSAAYPSGAYMETNQL